MAKGARFSPKRGGFSGKCGGFWEKRGGFLEKSAGSSACFIFFVYLCLVIS
jgi:hypothetical protein